ncbi:unannotated protein [freshwater metagenome]|uniref:Unannotated protein n=1 Tax=freshwater metagenome TaxID=449393 RepID=A0A6J7J839_9ZZZZ
MRLQVLRGLHAGGEFRVVQRLVDAGPEEPDERAGLGNGDVTERSPGCEDAAGGGVPQIDDVRQIRRLVCGDRRGDLDHLQKRDGALLHARSTRGRQREQRKPLIGGSVHRTDQAFTRGHPDGPGKKSELAQQDCHRASAHGRGSGENGFVETRLLTRRSQFVRVLVVDDVIGSRAVPRLETSGIDHQIEEFERGHPRHRIASFNQSRTSSSSAPRTGGARCRFSVTSVPSDSKNRSGGPGRVTVPRASCSTSMSSP